jgi:hypothetical protein
MVAPPGTAAGEATSMETGTTRKRGSRALLITLGVLLAAVFAGSVLGTGMMAGRGTGWSGWGMMGPGMMGGYGAPGGAAAGGWMGWAGMGLGWLAMLAFWGALLPCNVVVYEDRDAGGETVVAQDPQEMLGTVGNPALAPVAAEARSRLEQALAALGGRPR